MAKNKTHSRSQVERVFPVPAKFRRDAVLKPKDLARLYEKAAQDYVGFWADLAVAELDWHRPFSVPLDDMDAPNYRWFADGQLNVSHNCLDVHLDEAPDKVAIVFEGEPGDVRRLTYRELHAEVCRFANALKAQGVGKGDRVVIYLPLIPEAVIAMQACARIGAVHFGGIRRFFGERRQGSHRGRRRETRDHGRRRLARRQRGRPEACGRHRARRWLSDGAGRDRLPPHRRRLRHARRPRRLVAGRRFRRGRGV